MFDGFYLTHSSVMKFFFTVVAPLTKVFGNINNIRIYFTVSFQYSTYNELVMYSFVLHFMKIRYLRQDHDIEMYLFM